MGPGPGADGEDDGTPPVALAAASSAEMEDIGSEAVVPRSRPAALAASINVDPPARELAEPLLTLFLAGGSLSRDDSLSYFLLVASDLSWTRLSRVW